MQNVKVKTLFEQPIYSDDTCLPLTIRVVTCTKNEIVSGVPTLSTKGSIYVLFDVLPTELKQRVETAIRAIESGM